MSECDKWVWQLSRYDERLHAFTKSARPASFVEAACTHSVPYNRLTRSHTGPRCLACLLIVGDHLATHHHTRVGC